MADSTVFLETVNFTVGGQEQQLYQNQPALLGRLADVFDIAIPSTIVSRQTVAKFVLQGNIVKCRRFKPMWVNELRIPGLNVVLKYGDKISFVDKEKPNLPEPYYQLMIFFFY